jgi:WD40 repeat protein
MTSQPVSPPEKWLAFVCYRRVDGTETAQRLYHLLHGQTATPPNHAPVQVEVYLDTEMPPVGNWEEDMHRPNLADAKALIVVCTPGSRLDEGEGDWVQQEINWWLTHHRDDPPILVDPLGAGSRYVPETILKNWEKAQRLTLTDALQRQILDAFAKTGESVRQARLKRDELRTRRLKWLTVTLGCLLFVALLAAGVAIWQYYAAQRNLAQTMFLRTVDHLTQGQPRLALIEAARYLRTDPDSPEVRALTLGVIESMQWPTETLAVTGSIAAIGWDDRRSVRLAVWTSGKAPDGTALYGLALQAADGGSFDTPRLLAPHGPLPTFAVWSPGRERLIASLDMEVVHVVDSRTGRDVFKPLEHPGVSSAAWSHDGALVATGSADGSVHVWRSDSGARLPGPSRSGSNQRSRTAAVLALAWTRDQTRLAVGAADGSVTVWETRTWRQQGTSRLAPTAIRSLHWNPAGERLAVGDERTARIWAWKENRFTESEAIIGHEAWVTSVAWSSDGTRLASGSWDHTVKISDAAGHPLGPPLVHVKPVGGIAWSRDGESLITSAWEQVRVWRVTKKSAAIATLVHDGPVTSLAWNNSNSTLATGSWDKTTQVWDPNADIRSPKVQKVERQVNWLGWSPDSSRLAVADGSTVTVWREGQRSGPRSFGAVVVSAAWSYKGQWLAVASGETIYLWNPETDETKRRDVGAPVLAVAWSPTEDRFAAGTRIGGVHVWDLEQSEQRCCKEAHTSAVVSLAWSPDGRSLATGGWDTRARAWDVASGTKRFTSPLEHTDAVSSVTWSPDGTRLATGSWSGNLQVWNAATGRATTAPIRHRRAVVAVTWDPSGERLATGTVEGAVQVWSSRSGLPLGAPLRHQHSVQVLSWNRDGTRLASGSCDGTARVWATSYSEAVDSTELADAADIISFARLDPDSPSRVNDATAAGDYNRLRAMIDSAGSPLWSLLKRLIADTPPPLAADSGRTSDATISQRDIDGGIRPIVAALIPPTDWATIPHCSALIPIASGRPGASGS